MNIGAYQTGGWDIGAYQYTPSGGGTGNHYDLAVSFNSAIGVSSGNQGNVNAALSLDRNITVSQTGTGNVSVALQMGHLQAVTTVAHADALGAVTLYQMVGFTPDSTVQALADIILDYIATISSTNGSLVDAEINFGKTLSDFSNYIANVNVGIILDLCRSVAELCIANVNADLTLMQTLETNILAQAIALAGIDLDYTVEINNTATDSTMVIITHGCRVITVVFDNRTITVPSDNRTITIN